MTAAAGYTILSFGLKEGDIGVTKTAKRIPCAVEAHSFIQTPIEGQYLLDSSKTRCQLNKAPLLPGMHGDTLESTTAGDESPASLDGAPGFADEVEAVSCASNSGRANGKMSGNAERRHSDGWTIVSESSAKQHSVFRETNAEMYVTVFCRGWLLFRVGHVGTHDRL